MLGPTDDLATLIAIAVDKGADALGMAGGDGSLATVAAAAAEHDLPFICLPAGTRNHFASIWESPGTTCSGRSTPSRPDSSAGSTWPRSTVAHFNNISLGVYGDAVQRSGYRDAKLQTTLDTLHEVLSSTAPTPELLLTDDLAQQHTYPLVVLVSNNEYALDQPFAQGSRPRLDTGRLGIIGWTGPARSAPRSVRGARPRSRSRPPRPYPQASTARPSPCCSPLHCKPVPPRCAPASHATTRAPRPRPCSRHDNGANKVLMERAAEATHLDVLPAQSAPLALPAARAGVAGGSSAGAISFSKDRARGPARARAPRLSPGGHELSRATASAKDAWSRSV